MSGCPQRKYKRTAKSLFLLFRLGFCELVHNVVSRHGAMVPQKTDWGAGRMIDRSEFREQAAEILRRARRLPIGSERNDLRELATGLLWWHRHRAGALAQLSFTDRGGPKLRSLVLPLEGNQAQDRHVG
jgi:hypothetical protein